MKIYYLINTGISGPRVLHVSMNKTVAMRAQHALDVEHQYMTTVLYRASVFGKREYLIPQSKYKTGISREWVPIKSSWYKYKKGWLYAMGYLFGWWRNWAKWL